MWHQLSIDRYSIGKIVGLCIALLLIGSGGYAQSRSTDSVASPYLSSLNTPSQSLRPVQDSLLLQLMAQRAGQPSALVSYLLAGGVDSLQIKFGIGPSPFRLHQPSFTTLSPLSLLSPVVFSPSKPTALRPLFPDFLSSIIDERNLSPLLALGISPVYLPYSPTIEPYLPPSKEVFTLPTTPLSIGQVAKVEILSDGLSVIQRQYWVPSFESSVQFSQNYISQNWYKGGSTNLNILMRNYFALTYTKDRVQWKNEIESKLSVYNAEKDSLHRYRIADDLLRLRSNFGLRAIRKVYYSVDAELRTQLFDSPKENSHDLRSASFSPLSFNLGIGMKWDYKYRSTEVYGRAFSMSVNVAPLSYTYRVAPRTDIDLGRYGLSKDKPSYKRIGSTIRASWQWDVNMNLSWSSRTYFNTSYENVEMEWENTLNMRLTRYFSTQLNLYLRYDDAVRPAKSWNKYLQINEIISFGFSYRL